MYVIVLYNFALLWNFQIANLAKICGCRSNVWANLQNFDWKLRRFAHKYDKFIFDVRKFARQSLVNLSFSAKFANFVGQIYIYRIWLCLIYVQILTIFSLNSVDLLQNCRKTNYFRPICDLKIAKLKFTINVFPNVFQS